MVRKAKTKKKKVQHITAQPVSLASEEKWRAQDDARTLARASAIQKDPIRLKEAKKEAKAMLREEEAAAKEANNRLAAMRKIAKK